MTKSNLKTSNLWNRSNGRVNRTHAFTKRVFSFVWKQNSAPSNEDYNLKTSHFILISLLRLARTVGKQACQLWDFWLANFRLSVSMAFIRTKRHKRYKNLSIVFQLVLSFVELIN